MTHLLRTLEGVLSSKGHGNEVLVRVDEGVHDGDDGGVVEREGEGGDGGDTGRETVEELLVRNVENLGGEDVALVEDLDDGHTVGERRDVEHVEQRRLGRANTSAAGDDLNVGHDFDGTTSDLGRDTEGLEEGGLAGLHTGVTSRDDDILGGKSTSTSRRRDLVRGDDVTDLLEIAGGEHETDVALDVGEETLEGGELREDGAERTADHGVLAHDDNTLATEGDTDLVHLVGADVVDIDDEERGYTEVERRGLGRETMFTHGTWPQAP